MGNDFTSEEMELVENSKEEHITLGINLIKKLRCSVLEDFLIMFTASMRKKKNADIEKISNESRITNKSYLNFILLLFVNSDFNIEVNDSVSPSARNSVVKYFKISFNKKKVNDNLVKMLNFLYQKKRLTKKIFDFDLKEFPKYPNLREFFDFIIPKLTRYNEKFLLYRKVSSKLSITLVFRELIVELWHLFRTDKYIKVSRRIDEKIKSRSIGYREGLIIFIGIITAIGIIIISLVFLLIVTGIIPTTINIELILSTVFLPLIFIILFLSICVILKLKIKLRRIEKE
ncbi:hypothetical protein LCGC14_0730200 [marine sediment metagenome]|uniref:Uncharacterized protein n=1 Tax=marine sediment metagenome TaxID=412755 RepID=A0A0F9Q9U4_9ZZZZ